jgi:hypothetical protein
VSLRDDGDARPADFFRASESQVSSVDPHRSSVSGYDACERQNKRALSSAIRTEQCGDRPWFHAKVAGIHNELAGATH